MRPVQVLKAPIAPPGVCSKCGVGSGGNRSFFVDLGINSDMSQEGMQLDGVVYFCNHCINDLMMQYVKQYIPFFDNQVSQQETERINLVNQKAAWDTEKITLLKRLAEAKQQVEAIQKVKPPVGNAALDAIGSLDASLLKHGHDVVNDLNEVKNGPNGNDSNDEGSSGTTEADDPEPESVDPGIEQDSLTISHFKLGPLSAE